MTSTRFQLPKATPTEVVEGALRKHAATWIQRFYRHDLLVARTVRGLQADAVETFRIEVVGPVIRQLAAQLAEFPDRGADIAINSSPQLRRMIEQAEAIVRAGVEKLQRDVQAGLREVVGQETLWVQESAQKVLRLPDARRVDPVQVWRTVQDRPYLGGQVQEWFDSFVGGDNGAVDNIRYAVQTGIQRGWSTDETVRALRGTKAGKFADGLLTREQPAQLYALVRTAATHASTAAREASFEQLGVDRYRFIATLDSRTSIQCAANDGKIFEMGNGPLPPLHPNAVLAGSTFVPYGRLEEFVHARYSGPCIDVTAGGYRTTIGPNHPMLTSRGMVKAAELRKGDKLLRDLRHDRARLGSGEANLEKIPMVEDVLRSLLASGNRSLIATAGHDLHGDRIFCQGEVGVVVPDRFLLPVFDSQGIEQLRKVPFMLADVSANPEAGSSASDLGFERVCLPASGGVSGADSWVLADDHWRWVPVDDVVPSWFEGMAFDATTASSLYCSDGFVVSNCRSTIVPYIGEPIGNRASVDGPVPADLTFRQWLEGQPISVQNEVLGPSRAAAWRAGDLPFEKMVTTDLLPISVEQLKAKDIIPDEED